MNIHIYDIVGPPVPGNIHNETLRWSLYTCRYSLVSPYEEWSRMLNDYMILMKISGTSEIIDACQYKCYIILSHCITLMTYDDVFWI